MATTSGSYRNVHDRTNAESHRSAANRSRNSSGTSTSQTSRSRYSNLTRNNLPDRTPPSAAAGFSSTYPFSSASPPRSEGARRSGTWTRTTSIFSEPPPEYESAIGSDAEVHAHSTTAGTETSDPHIVLAIDYGTTFSGSRTAVLFCHL